MALQVTNDNWIEKVDTVVPGTEDLYLLGEFTNPFVIVEIQSTIADPVWNKAGEIAQSIDTEIGTVYGKKQELFLRNPNLINFDSLSTESYKLWYFPLDRLGNTSVKVYEYRGETIDSQIQILVDGLKQSDLLNEDLSAIGAMLDRILLNQEQLSTTYMTSTSETQRLLNLILDCLTPTEPPEPPEPKELDYLELRTLKLI